MNRAFLLDQLNTAAGITHVTDAERESAVARAVAAYSVFFPAARRMGEAQVALPSAQGTNTITVAGGTFRPGSSILIDAGGWSQLAAVVSARATIQDAKEAVGLTRLTLSANLTRAVDEGEAVTFADSRNLGIALVAGQENYPLPDDFVNVCQESFDLAIGAKSTYHRQATFYDYTYAASGLLSGTFRGYAAGFAGYIPGFTNSPIVPSSDGPMVRGLTPPGVRFRFYAGAGRPRLVVSPAPTADTHLAFDYLGMQTLSSVPTSELEAMIAYCRYVLFTAEASELAQMLEYSEGGVAESPTRNAKTLSEQADEALKRFHTLVQARPYMVSG